MEDQAAICNELIRLFPDFNWHVVAHSMGGAIGLLLSDDILARIKSFSNLEGNLMPEDCFTSRKVTDHSVQSFQNELLPKSTGNFRLGEQAHLRLARLTLQNDIPLQELNARADADYKNIRREMFLVCIPLYKIMDPKINLDNPPPNLNEDQLINTAVTHVLNKISP